MSQLSAIITMMMNSDIPTLWTPAAITTALWLDANDAATFTLTGTSVDEWRDKSGNDRHMTPPATAPTRTATGINSMGSVVFGSGQDILQTGSFANPDAADGVLVAWVMTQTGTPVAFSVPLMKGAINAQWSFVFPRSDQSAGNHPGKSVWRHTTSRQVVSTTNIGTSTARVLTGNCSGTAMAQFFTGNAEGSAGTVSTNFGASSAFTIGGNTSTGNQFEGQIGEIVVVYADMTAATRQLLEGYLAWKWGLQASLPGGHPYKDAPPYV